MAAPHVAGAARWSSAGYGVDDPVHGGLTLDAALVERYLAATAADVPCDARGPGRVLRGRRQPQQPLRRRPWSTWCCPCPRPRQRADPVLRVMTWNLWWRFGPWESWPGRHRGHRSRRRHPTSWVSRRCGWRRTAPTRPRCWPAGSAPTTAPSVSLRFHDGLAFTNALLSRWPLRAVESPSAAPGRRLAVAPPGGAGRRRRARSAPVTF